MVTVKLQGVNIKSVISVHTVVQKKKMLKLYLKVTPEVKVKNPKLPVFVP